MAELEPQRVRVAANVEDAQLRKRLSTLPTAGVSMMGWMCTAIGTRRRRHRRHQLGRVYPVVFRPYRRVHAIAAHRQMRRLIAGVTRRRAALILGPIAASNMMTTAASSARPHQGELARTVWGPLFQHHVSAHHFLDVESVNHVIGTATGGEVSRSDLGDGRMRCRLCAWISR